MKRICKQCGKEFELSQSEINFYKEKNLSIPKRCRECRNANKQKKDGLSETNKISKENKGAQEKAAVSYGSGNVHKRPGFAVGMCILAIAVVLAFYAAGKAIPGWIENEASADLPVQSQIEMPEKVGAASGSDDAASEDMAAWKQAESVENIAPDNDVPSDIGMQNLPEPENDSSPKDEKAAGDSGGSYILTFRNAKMLDEHFQKHGIEMGFSSAEDYQAAAAAVVNNPDSLHKLEAEDGDDVYYLESTNEFVIVSTDGYIRTYFMPDAGIEYYDRQ